MEQQDFLKRYETYRRAVEEYLSGLFAGDVPYQKLYESMRYSLLSGGKRIRPVLALEFAALGGLAWREALPFACAVELMHTSSLIHDDLPCMDDDELRRGKPTNHVVFGVTMATLAGDALQQEAMRLILESSLPAEARARGALYLARGAGADGMVGGQVLDLGDFGRDEPSLTTLHGLKTGEMIAAAAGLGCAAAGAPEEMHAAARRYALNLGLAFQIRDDMLDVIGDEATLGKPICSDREQGKVTFADVLGLEECEKEVRRLTEKAVAALGGWDRDGFLTALAWSLVSRKS
ncbi:MAG: polyprenyl synthetase family protein [Oscillospiraceae bacterium]|nr:polyprenyl synthetase family protein [Oscillospiraceae bacterium]